MLGDLTSLQYDDEFFGPWQTINNAMGSRVNKKINALNAVILRRLVEGLKEGRWFLINSGWEFWCKLSSEI